MFFVLIWKKGQKTLSCGSYFSNSGYLREGAKTPRFLVTWVLNDPNLIGMTIGMIGIHIHGKVVNPEKWKCTNHIPDFLNPFSHIFSNV